MAQPPKNVVVVGKPGVGKTSLIHALTGLSRDLAPTVAPDLFALARDSAVVHVWDTPGQERFSSIAGSLLAQADLVLSCSDDGTFVSPGGAAPVLRVRTKDDLGRPWFPADLATSALSGAGVRALYDALFEVLARAPAAAGCCGCCGCGFHAVATHTLVEQYRLDLVGGITNT